MAFYARLEGSAGSPPNNIQLHAPGSGRRVVAFDLGDENRDEVWIEPYGSEIATLAAATSRKTVISIVLQVQGTSLTDLITKLEDIRNKCQSTDLVLSYSVDDAVIPVRSLSCYPSAIDPVPLSGPELQKWAANSFLVPAWQIRLVRQPSTTSVSTGGVKPPVL